MGKCINISDEHHKFLLEAQKQLAEQNNRSTRNPLYVIMNKREEIRPDTHAQNFTWYDNDNCETMGSSDAEFFKELTECPSRTEDLEEIFSEELEDGYTLEAAFLEHIENKDNFDKNGIGDFSKYYSEEIEFIPHGNTFSLFEKDAKDHLESNNYHYHKDAITYACSIWRSPMMEALRELLTKIDLNENWIE